MITGSCSRWALIFFVFLLSVIWYVKTCVKENYLWCECISWMILIFLSTPLFWSFGKVTNDTMFKLHYFLRWTQSFMKIKDG